MKLNFISTKQTFCYCLIVSALLLFASCQSQKVTFSKEYEKELAEKPTRLATIDPMGKYIFGVESQSKSGMGGAPEAFVLNTDNGEEIWFDKMKNLGDIESDPDHILWIWPENKAIFYSKNFDMKISCIDLTTGEELWNRNEKRNQFAMGGKYIPKVGGVITLANDAFVMFDAKTGENIWSRPDLYPETNLTEFIFGNGKGLNYHYLKEEEKILLSVNEELYCLNSSSGETIWKIDKNIGSVSNADLFEQEGVALFYGPTDDQLGNTIANTTSLGDKIMEEVSSGMVEEDIIYVDLKKGGVRWRNSFYSNGDHQPILLDDQLVMTGIILNVFNRKSGELEWKNIDDDRFQQETVWKAFSVLTDIDLTSKGLALKNELIFDNTIYALYPEMLDESILSNKLSVRKYDLKTGELIWKSEPEKANVNYYFGAEGVLFLVGMTDGFVSRPMVMAYDGASGKKLYEKKYNGLSMNKVFAMNGRVYVNFYRDGNDYSKPGAQGIQGFLEAFDLRTGKEIELNLPSKNPIDIKKLQSEILVAYQKPGKLILHKASDFSEMKSVDIPRYYKNFDYRNGTLFMHDLDGTANSGIVALDIENFTLKGYLLNSKKGTYTTNGQDQVYKDYHLFLTEDGKHIYEINKDELVKYRVEN